MLEFTFLAPFTREAATSATTARVPASVKPEIMETDRERHDQPALVADQQIQL